jgi:hypothetical protein
MAGSGDELAGAGDRSRLRASDADRERVAAVLKAAFVQGRLTKDEFDLRVAQVLASRTYADLEALTADIPAGVAKTQPPGPAPDVDNKKLIQRVTAVGAGVGMVIPAVLITVAGGPLMVAVLAGVLLGALMAALLAGFLTILSWVLDKTSGRQPSQQPPAGASGTAYQRPASADPTGSSAQISPEPPHTAEAGRGRRPRPRLPGLRPQPLSAVGQPGYPSPPSTRIFISSLPFTR